MTDSIKAREIVSGDIARVRRSYRVSFERMRRKPPAFKPQWEAGTGAEQLYRRYFSGLTSQEFEGSRYQRIGHIKKLLADGILDAELRHTHPLHRRKVVSANAPALSLGS
jgi:hypothetical protein